MCRGVRVCARAGSPPRRPQKSLSLVSPVRRRSLVSQAPGTSIIARQVTPTTIIKPVSQAQTTVPPTTALQRSPGVQVRGRGRGGGAGGASRGTCRVLSRASGGRRPEDSVFPPSADKGQVRVPFLWSHVDFPSGSELKSFPLCRRCDETRRLLTLG